MKRILLLVIVYCALTFSAFAGGNFYSYVVKPSDGSARIAVPNHRYIKFLTFTAEGAPDCTITGPGTFQTCTFPSIKAQIAGQPAVTLSEGVALPVGHDIYVTGPAFVTVTTNTTQTIFLTILQDSY